MNRRYDAILLDAGGVLVHPHWPMIAQLLPELGLSPAAMAVAEHRAIAELLGLGRFFPIVVDSHEEKIEKPDPRVFLPALKALGVTPDRVLYVGDLFHIDVLGARAAGIDAVLLDRDDLRVHVDAPRIRTLGELLERVTS